MKKNPRITGICAAAIALVLIAGIVFGIGSGSGSGGNTADTVTAGSEEGSEETTGTDKPLTLESGIYASSPVIVGEGGSMVMDNPGYDLCICGMLINLEDGICNLMHGALSLGGVVNPGTFTHTPRIGMSEMKMESYFFNSGTLLIEGTEDNAPYACLASGGLRNSASGIIEIGEDACMVNLTGIENQGQIILTSATASFLNRGTLDMNCQYVGTLEVSAGSFENTGIVMYTQDGYPYASEDANAFSMDGAVEVSSASALQEALQDESISRIKIEGDITWEDGDLLISEKEVMQYGSLTVTGGDLTVENGVFWCSGQISLDGGTFTAQGLGVVYAGGGISGCSVLNIQASSTVILGDGELHDMEINLNVGDSENGDARLTTKYGLSLYNCQMTLATENCYVYCWRFSYDESSTVSTVGDPEGQIIIYEE